jgi:archaellum biogenesis ATPase FlaH
MIEFKTLFRRYEKQGFKPVRCKGYHPHYNPKKDYKIAKEPVDIGFTKSDYKGFNEEQLLEWVKQGGWIGWLIPEGYIALDMEDKDSIGFAESYCKCEHLEPGIHVTNRGKFYFFKLSTKLSASSNVYTRCGLEVTYRVGGKNYVILAPINKRDWESWRPLNDLPELPGDFYPYDPDNIDEVLNCLSWQVGVCQRQGLLQGYEDIDFGYMSFLIDCGLTEQQIHRAFHQAFLNEYDLKRTEYIYNRTKEKMQKGDSVCGTGSFVHHLREYDLKIIQRFCNDLGKVIKAHRPSQFHNTYIGSETVKLKVSTLQDILNYEDPAYLIDSILIENSLTLLSGYSGVYKSILSSCMALSVLTGQKLFGHFDVIKKGKVLIVDEENPGAFLKERVQKMGFTNHMPVSFFHFQKVRVDNPDCFAEVLQVIKDIKPTLVIFDTLIRIHTRKENETEMALVMERLRDIVNLGVTVLVIHHHRKGAGDKKEAVRGSSDILAGVDIHLSIEEKEKEKDHIIVLSSPKSRTKPLDSMRLKFEATNSSMGIRYIGDELSKNETKNQKAINEIVEILQGDARMGVEEIFEKLKNRDCEIGQNKL